MAQVAVVGGGIAGLATALFTARRGHDVVLFERDAEHPTGDADHDFETWRRPGVPQARQPHLFHALSGAILRTEAPEVAAATIETGGPGLRIHIAPQLLHDPDQRPGDADLVTVGMRRVAFEAVLRAAVEAESNVTLLEGVAVDGLITGREQIAGVPHVVGVRTDRESIDANLVVDATGRRSPLPIWLAELDARPPVDESQDLRFAYHTRWYRLPDEAPVPPLWPPFRDLGFGAAIAFPADAGLVAVVFALATSDPLRGQLRDPDTFHRLAMELDLGQHYLGRGAVPETDVYLMARLENRARRLVDDQGPIVTGLVAVGDSAVYTNPTLGRGASLALAHAQHLAESVERLDCGHGVFAVDFDKWTETEIVPWFSSQVLSDGGRLTRIEAALRGDPAPQPTPREQFLNAVFACANTDPHVARVLARVSVLLDPPSVLGTDAHLLQQVQNLLTENGGPILPPPPVMTRAEFEQLVA